MSKTESIRIRLSDEQKEYLDRKSTILGTTISELIRQLVTKEMISEKFSKK